MSIESDIDEAVESAIRSNWTPDMFMEKVWEAWLNILDERKQSVHRDFMNMKARADIAR